MAPGLEIRDSTEAAGQTSCSAQRWPSHTPAQQAGRLGPKGGGQCHMGIAFIHHSATTRAARLPPPPSATSAPDPKHHMPLLTPQPPGVGALPCMPPHGKQLLARTPATVACGSSSHAHTIIMIKFTAAARLSQSAAAPPAWTRAFAGRWGRTRPLCVPVPRGPRCRRAASAPRPAS